MLFSSITFLYVFLPAVLLLYFIAPRKIRNLILLMTSLIFYGWGEPKYIIVMVVSIIVGYIFGRLTGSFKKKSKDKTAKLCVVLSTIVNLGILIFFKYTDFFISNINKVGGFGIKLLDLALPLGISFYTFQILSYSIDVYRGEVEPQKNIIDLAAYITLFPQLIAGPIVRYQTIEKQLKERKESIDLFASGVMRFVIGLGKKVIIANSVASMYETIKALPDEKSSVALYWVASLLFSFQIYFDFSGYSDMAIGLGRLFGFEFLENFEHPYISKSITEFWRRWHISLSSWFKDYVYIPLGGNRCKKSRMFFNIFIVWLLTGFWHGAEWNFIIWGLYYFIILMLEKSFLLRVLKKLPAVLQHIYSLFLINMGWVIFSNDNLDKLGKTLRCMFGIGNIDLYNKTTAFYLLSFIVMIILAAIGSTEIPKKIGKKIDDSKAGAIGAVIFILIVMTLSTAGLASDAFNPFMYFRF
ncbi:alginate O-acetyltransferase complex protein AlgI [Eubacterium ruminantium]|uniref:Alginate O-acetyltransferase complex protein AlgI n=2 Tax=Eubacterium ruminantium TaxID=42322 RepID=A0A1T4M439_9FIRM|nr:MBOAT family O-acyltransferase [Eubacterium ruminantium]SCW37079.1 alginate O-acetyltransferase complex protein AlgI [Eubacterium ruminantium]SDM48039.1 alginate O-acetyltransferase complex protein AlgI [Eubacterium ruminantium]SJZ61770.1 alginate O-acetyltransferase complex protein AlgI [Eubacterium ruminantium]